jgi:ankyrin repeat protein
MSLLYACRNRHATVEMIKLLIPNSDINHVNRYGNCALMNACEYNCIDFVKWLLHAGADVNIKTNNGFTPLMITCYHGHGDIARLLLDAGADADIQDSKGRTAFMHASDLLQLLKLLLPYSNILIVNNKNKTVMDKVIDVNRKLIAASCNEEELKKLLEHKYYKEIYDEILMRHKRKIILYERVLRKIPEQDATIRFKQIIWVIKYVNMSLMVLVPMNY